jgi:glycosyltransferase involved in cell wall biosynthesis
MKIGIDLRYLQQAYNHSRDGGLGGMGKYSKGLWNALVHGYPNHYFVGLVDSGNVPVQLKLISNSLCNAELRSIGVSSFPSLTKYFKKSSYSWIYRAIQNKVVGHITSAFDDLDVIHILHQLPAPRVKCKTVITIYDCIPFGSGNLVPNVSLMESIRRSYLKSMNRADALVCISKSTEKDAHFYIQSSRAKTCVIYPGIDNDVFCLRGNQESQLQFCNPKVPFFLHVGVCVGRKNPDVLLKSISLLTGLTDSPFIFLFVGPYQVNLNAKKHILDLAKFLNISEKIYFAGDVSDEILASLYQGAVSLVFPSLYEGFGYPVAEALACGGRCITSESSSLPEVMGEYGTIVNPINPMELADAMLANLLNSKSETLENRTQRTTHASNFSWKKAAAAHISLYEDLTA